MREIFEVNRSCFFSRVHHSGLKSWKTKSHQGHPKPVVFQKTQRMNFTDNLRVRIRKDFFFNRRELKTKEASSVPFLARGEAQERLPLRSLLVRLCRVEAW